MTDRGRYAVDVQVEAVYLPTQSNPTERRYAFAYTVTIRNTGAVDVTLLTRHWIITDAEGRVQEVRGEGVVGQQPRIAPGESFRYTSGTLIETPVGSMHGSYRMQASDGVEFDAAIDAFRLADPRTVH
ncbi:MAG: Co2+/Mg2+ efflux protein ApaG [Nitrococcus sp.]|nr:Co2+/Mg2+ efflux protein ApaG [Nitrococcus sp.]